MPRPAELSRVLARAAARDFVVEHVKLLGCRLAIVGADGTALRTDPEMPPLRSVGPNARPVIEGVDGRAASVPIAAFDRLLGWVVALAPETDVSRTAARTAAERAAAMLSELCAREYELDDLSREILGAYEELDLFYTLAGDLAGAPDPAAVCRVVIDRAARVIQARRAWILLADRATNLFRVGAAREAPDGDGALRLDEGLAGRVFGTRTCELVDDVAQGAPVELVGWEREATRSLITVPLYVPGQDDRAALGVLQMCDAEGGGPFTSGDLKLAQALASQAAVLIENSRLIGYERELRIARTIQQSLLPAAPPRVAGLDVAGACLAAVDVGGDYYDHVVLADGRLAVLVADVSGHNLAAALMQTAARTTFRAAFVGTSDPVEVVARANRVLHDDLSRAELFLTAWLAIVDPVTGEAAYCDAGHNPALVVRREGGIEWLTGGGLPIGVALDGLYTGAARVLEPGDILAVYTDGITEAAPTGDPAAQFGEERLARSIAAHAALPAAALVAAVLADVSAHEGGRSPGDDRSLLVVKRTGALSELTSTTTTFTTEDTEDTEERLR